MALKEERARGRIPTRKTETFFHGYDREKTWCKSELNNVKRKHFSRLQHSYTTLRPDNKHPRRQDRAEYIQPASHPAIQPTLLRLSSLAITSITLHPIPAIASHPALPLTTPSHL
ncbi:hypothetical protein Pmani_031447 [Petrolisthes manimaculis]|uniref:Uncharacterized protein n=1 Tax=Petrolisthes manimaculis TaxID=1843537 RepID=A0AAE1NVM7_9EUCA|nr:hypothetical protein Pmani_031447 [Petrolisthes manimaculis]